MKHAIAELEIALQSAVTNEPVHQAEGNAGQADLCAERAREFEDVISLLKAFDHLKDRGQITKLKKRLAAPIDTHTAP